VRDDVVGELGVEGHTVVRGWVWLGAVNQEILANAREVGVKQPLTTTHGYKINLPGCRTDARIFFALRVIHPWNSLKLTPASMSSLPFSGPP